MAEERNIAEELLGKPAPEPTEKAPPPQQATEAMPQAPTAETPPAPKPEPQTQPPPGYVPLAAHLDERDRRQKIEASWRELEAKLKQYERQPDPVPSIQDPEQLARYIEATAERASWNAKANWSEHSARKEHGSETVDKALEWAFAKGEDEKNRFGFSPFAAEQVSAVHPVDWVVKAYQQHQAFSEYGDDEAKQKVFIEKRARQLGLIPDPAATASVAQPQPTPAPQPPRPVPSKSLASAPSAGGSQTIPTGPGVAFDSAFNR